MRVFNKFETSGQPRERFKFSLLAIHALEKYIYIYVYIFFKWAREKTKNKRRSGLRELI